MRKFQVLRDKYPDIEGELPRIRRLFSSQRVILAYLYGGYGRGDVGPLSDIDIAVLYGAEAREIWDLRMATLDGLIDILGRDDIDLGVLNRASPLFRFEAIKGKLLFAKSERTRVEFERKTISEYLDTKYIYSVYRRYLYKDIEEGRFIDKL
ncbi:MAG: type VII toxin-antitoxin system MntA family adenylyltransferase antitoxin [bacterium]